MFEVQGNLNTPMFVPHILFWILTGWSLYDGDLDARDAAWFIGVWLALGAGSFLFSAAALWLQVGVILLDIVLVLKVFGQDIAIR